ncbi:MAG: MBOAT family O-acyltransferase [Bacteroidales bacterium]
MDYLIDFLLYHPQKPFLFTSFSFWIFLALVLAVFSLIYKNRPLRNAFLFLCSLFFYYKTGGYFVVLLIFSVALNFWCAKRIDKSSKPVWRRCYLIIGIFINLALLTYFKYTAFFTDLCNDLFNTNYPIVDYLSAWSNRIIHSDFSIDAIALPIGISFFTFQALSYIIDTYKGKIKALTNFIDFGFYLCFFPQLVAGPIVRASDFIPQLHKHYQLSSREFSIGLFLILNGLIKKMIISDFISLHFVDRVFENPGLFTGFETWMAAYGYTMQIYCDFSGYTDIAIGVAALLGFQLPINFNSPYKAACISDFWHRWHISLSTWLKDYLYIPLGGNKKGRARTYINLLITMLLGGLWHGANLKFLLWGALHGLFLCIDKITHVDRYVYRTRILRSLGIILTFHIVCFTWLFFRASSVEEAWFMFLHIFSYTSPAQIAGILQNYYQPLLFIAIALLVHLLPQRFKNTYQRWFYDLPFVVKGLVCCVIISLIYLCKSSELQPFIYFQF